MPHQSGDAAGGRQTHRHSRASSRVVPAIPLPLSKPKSARPQPNTNSVAKPGKAHTALGKNGSSDEQETNGLVGEEGPLQLQESGQARATANGAQNDSVMANSARTPTSRATTSDSAVPDASSHETPAKLPNGHDSAPSPTVTSSPSAARKPIDRMDMRPIRTELPPAFIPSAQEQQGSQPGSSSQAQQYVPILPHAHPRHPSANNIVFGQRESSDASPAPNSAGSTFVPPPYAAQAPVFGHGHHVSEPYPQRMQHPAHHQANHNWSIRSGNPLPPQYHPHAHMPFRYPAREPYTPNGTPFPNGHGSRSRAGSQASSATHGIGGDLQSPAGFDRGLDGARTAYPDPPRHLPTFSQHIPMTQPPFAHPEFIENAESLRDHILSQFRRPELSDCHLHIAEADGIGQQYLEGHRLVLTRSSTLTSIIRHSEVPMAANHKLQVQVLLKGRYVRVGPFLEAVRYLYGGPLPSPDTYGPSFAQLGHEERMEVALQHIATGAWLNVSSIAGRGVDMAAHLLNWESLTSALIFALDGGIGQTWPGDEGSEELISTCSSDDSLNKPEAGGSPRYDPYSTGLLHRVIDFMVQNLPPSFYLDQVAPQMIACPRLPNAPSHESKASGSDPRLTKIRFGEFEDQRRPPSLFTTISSILLSLPLPLLKYMLEHPLLSSRLGSETVSSIMRQVVSERENRRLRSLKSRDVSNVEDGLDRTLIQNLYWEESVEQSAHHKAGFRLARKRRGIETPPSSGAESDKTK